MRNPLAGAIKVNASPPPSRVCQPLFADLKAEAEDRFRYAGAERMRNQLAG
jgi:hypothetical protein